jgi:hypothetical protein
MPIEKNNQTKEVNRLEPFVRIRSREFKPDAPHADGKGRDCGCRNAGDYDSIIISAILLFGLDELEDAIPVPAELKEAAKKLLKAGGADADDFKQKLAKFLGNPIEGLAFGTRLKQVPTWVPVGRKVIKDENDKKKFDPSFREKDKEVAGILSRSFQSCLDLPLLPWQRFYNWNFHVRVDKDSVVVDPDGTSKKGAKGGFAHVIGIENVPNESEQNKISVNPNRAAFDVAPRKSLLIPTITEIVENSLECVMDTGAFSRSPGNVFDGPSRPQGVAGGDILPGVMFHPRWPFWPMTNDYFWAQGRWVFDCSHAHDFASDDNDRHWTQIHPVRAFACFRSEGFKFDENLKRVPASRFLFFACHKGGYLDLSTFDQLSPEDDPQFIVDLPPAPVTEDLTWSIGHTEHFDINTGVLRPRLLIKTEFAPFGIPGTFFQEGLHFAHKVDPIIEPIRSKPDVKIFDQVKITVPLSKLPKEAPAFGFVTSLGWADPTNELAAGVKKVTVTLDRLRELDKDGELRFKIGVNGHWAHGPLHSVSAEDLAFGGSITVFLPLDAKVSLSVHGQKRRGYGRVFEEERDEDRQLNVGGLFPFGSGKLRETIESIKKQLDQKLKVIDMGGVKVEPAIAEGMLKTLDVLADVLGERRKVDWLKDVDQPDDVIASAVARELFFKKFFDTFDEPLGLVDDNDPHNFGFETGRNPTPLVLQAYAGDTVAGLVEDFVNGKTSRAVTVLAHKTEAAGDAHLLSFNSLNIEDGRDYLFDFTITVEDQP